MGFWNQLRGIAMDLRRLQAEVAEWSAKNFGTPYGSGYRPLLGVVEEVGELSHAHLKVEQGIRGGQDHWVDKVDAVGDILIYLADYCAGQGIDMDDAVRKTWDKVRQRDWKKNPESGVEEEDGDRHLIVEGVDEEKGKQDQPTKEETWEALWSLYYGYQPVQGGTGKFIDIVRRFIEPHGGMFDSGRLADIRREVKNRFWGEDDDGDLEIEKRIWGEN